MEEVFFVGNIKGMYIMEINGTEDDYSICMCVYVFKHIIKTIPKLYKYI